MKQNPPITEKPSLFHIRAETVETWPARCTREKQTCLQCYVEAKIGCAPRFNHPPRQIRPELVKSLSLQGKRLDEIAQQTGLTLSEVYAERARLRWAGVPIPRLHLGKGEVI